MDPNILYEDASIIVVVKPAQVPSQKDLSGDLDMTALLMAYFIKKYPKLEKPYVGLIHRLDRPVSGVMVFAKRALTNARLSEQIREGHMSKEYLAVVCGTPKEGKGELVDYLTKSSNNLSKVVKEVTADAKKAVLHYEHIKTILDDRYGDISLLRVQLLTGRHHQIRVQLSHAGLPIWGDTRYNLSFNTDAEVGQKKSWYQIALCANKLSFEHPKTNKLMTFEWEPKDYPFDQFTH
ncbi:MAG: RluA family pseudouridine synthase [Vallitaleaceae bacterium]|nr:RluA family pseudouridine synthase [Vallitaleaceae bacterium]